jgi:hypothetical protein
VNSAVDVDRLAGHEVVLDDEPDRLCDVLCASVPPERGLLGELLHPLGVETLS